MTEKVDLVGLEYLWKAVLVAPDNIVYKPIELLRDVYTNLSPKLQQDQVACVCVYVHIKQGAVVIPSMDLHKQFCLYSVHVVQMCSCNGNNYVPVYVHQL